MFGKKISPKGYLEVLIVGEIILIFMEISDAMNAKDIYYSIIAYFMIVLIFTLVSKFVDSMTS